MFVALGVSSVLRATDFGRRQLRRRLSVTLEGSAYYREFVKLERLKKNSQFHANRTVFSVMPNGVVARMPYNAEGTLRERFAGQSGDVKLCRCRWRFGWS